MNTVDDLRAALAYPTAPTTVNTDAIITRARRRRATRRTVLAGGLAVVGTVAFAVLPESGGGPRPAAAAVLDRAALTAAAAPGPATADGTVWFTETRHTALHDDIAVKPGTGTEEYEVVGTFLVQRELTTRVWLALPDRQRYDQRIEKYVAAPSARAAWISAGRPTFLVPPNLTDDPGTKDTWQLLLDNHLDPEDRSLRQELDLLRRLPTRADPLAGWLREQVRNDAPGESLVQWCPPDAGFCTDDAKVFQAAAALLASPVAPVALRAALYEVMADLPGIRLDGTVTDGAGRTATQVSITTGHLRYELLLDPNTAALLATRHVLVTPQGLEQGGPKWTGVPAGTVVRSELYLRRGTVSSVGATP